MRTLRSLFSHASPHSTSLLPTLKTFGDNDEDDFNRFEFPTPDTPPRLTVDPVYRQVQLARLVKHWVKIIGQTSRELFRDEDMIIPSTTAEALFLSSKIAELIDQMGTEEVSWHQLKKLVPEKDQYANWWQLTLDFLQIAMESWPAHLAQINAVDPATERKLLLDLRSAQLSSQPSKRIIAAGSTGSIPATTRFLVQISSMPNGAVILPGLDMHMDDDSWKHVLGCEDHPQFGLAKLLQAMEINRGQVEELDRPDRAQSLRPALVSASLLPSKKTAQWRQWTQNFGDQNIEKSAANITIIEAPAERQEAMAIALVLREQIETPKTRTALVTPNRKLARQVAAELKRFSLNIDDSGGTELANTPNAIFVRLLLGVVSQPPNAITLASFIKSPFLNAALQDENEIPRGRLFELCLLRDVLEVPAPGNFAAKIHDFYGSLNSAKFISPIIKNISEDQWQQIIEFCEKLDRDLAPLINITGSGKEVGLDQYFETLKSVSLQLTDVSENEDTPSKLFDLEFGTALESLIDEIITSTNQEISFHPSEAPSVFDALIAGNVVRSIENTHPRLAILGPLEARLQPLDCVILGGLTEDNWPGSFDSGPFLSRPMRTQIELSTPERRIGLSAHDFEQLMGTPKVFLTYANRMDNSPTVPSRWLQRLSVICGADITGQMKQRGKKYLSWVTQIDTPQKPTGRIGRPNPKPDVKVRPNRLSITEIETWIRDPYAIFAKHVLSLRALGQLGESSIFAVRGTILHDALAQFVEKQIDPRADHAINDLLEMIDEHMKNSRIPDQIRAVWEPRFHEIASAFITHEHQHRKNIVASHCEIDGTIKLSNGSFEVSGRADRIDRLKDGTCAIIDYKTGTKPSIKMARTLSPQLALEGAIAISGGFVNLPATPPSTLEYIRLRARGEFKIDKVETANPPIDATQLCSETIAELENLIDTYRDNDKGYISRFAVELNNNYVADYDHLARVREWSLGDENADAADD